MITISHGGSNKTSKSNYVIYKWILMGEVGRETSIMVDPGPAIRLHFSDL